MNFQHKYDLVEAERYALRGQQSQAMKYYDRAIKGARENEYIQEEALANELAGKFHLHKHRDKVAQAYFADAISCYESWGATAKVQHLQETYLQSILITRSQIQWIWKSYPSMGELFTVPKMKLLQSVWR
jgi:tetratricopeptide (TPR) repeat protein